MNEEEQIVDVGYGPVVRERPDRYGSVPGLDDEELADPAELERWVMYQQWGPILALPVKRRHRWFYPTLDEHGKPDGAFGSVDFERLYGKFDKFRYKADKLREELASHMIMLEMLMERVPSRAKYMVLKYLNMGIIDLDHIDNPDMHAIGRRHLRCRRLRREIQRLQQFSRQGWCDHDDDDD